MKKAILNRRSATQRFDNILSRGLKPTATFTRSLPRRIADTSLGEYNFRNVSASAFAAERRLTIARPFKAGFEHPELPSSRRDDSMFEFCIRQ